MAGFLSSYALKYTYIDTEKPLLIGLGNIKQQPNNYINKNQIQVEEDRIIIYIKNAKISRYASTGSMLLLLGENANGIEIIPLSPEQISIGNLVTFESQGELIIHRVIDKGQDSKGYWFVTKGDNNPKTDGKIYFSQVKYITIALIY